MEFVYIVYKYIKYYNHYIIINGYIFYGKYANIKANEFIEIFSKGNDCIEYENSFNNIREFRGGDIKITLEAAMEGVNSFNCDKI